MRKHRFSVSRIGIVLLLAMGSLPVAAQQESSESPRQLTLRQAISLATDSSLASFRARHSYLSSYWQYRTYKAQNLPQLNLTSTPISYNQNFVLRYNSDTNTDEYRPQQNISSSLGLSVQQNVGPLGGTFYIESDLSFYRNFGDADQQQFSATPFRIGYYQPLFGYNQYRWNKRIEPIKYEAAKRTLLYNMEDIAQQVTDLFFALVMAQENYKMGQANLANADTLYAIGQQKYDIASISKSDLLSLKLDVVDARNSLENYRLELKRAKFSLTSYLNLPGGCGHRTGDTRSAGREFYRSGKGAFLRHDQQSSDHGIPPPGTRSGIRHAESQGGEPVFGDPACQRRLQPGGRNPRFGVPKPPASGSGVGGIEHPPCRLGHCQRAVQHRQEQLRHGDGLHRAGSHLARAGRDHDRERIQHPARSGQVFPRGARTGPAGVSQHHGSLYHRGKANVTDLTSAFSRQNTAQTNYITALRNYWNSYAKIKKLTLFDFENGMSLSENFDLMYSMLTSRR